MSTRKVTAHAVSCEIGHELGLILTMVDGDVQAHQVQKSRSTGIALAVSSVISSLLFAKPSLADARSAAERARRLALSSVEMVIEPDVYEAVVEVCENGRVLIPEAVNVLLGISQLVKQYREEGLTISFTMGMSELSETRQADFEEAKARELRNFEKHQVRIGSWTLPKKEAEWVEDNNATIIYTDGACISSSGFSAWAWHIDEERFDSGTVAPASSSYAERRAALEALQATSGPVLLVSDHSNLLMPPSARVLAAREQRVLKSLRRMVKQRQVRILTVRGHADCPGNITVDKLVSSTLLASWAKVASDAELRQRITDLHAEARANLKQARQLADIRRDLHRANYDNRFAGKTASERNTRGKRRPQRLKATV